MGSGKNKYCYGNFVLTLEILIGEQDTMLDILKRVELYYNFKNSKIVPLFFCLKWTWSLKMYWSISLCYYDSTLKEFCVSSSPFSSSRFLWDILPCDGKNIGWLIFQESTPRVRCVIIFIVAAHPLYPYIHQTANRISITSIPISIHWWLDPWLRMILSSYLCKLGY